MVTKALSQSASVLFLEMTQDISDEKEHLNHIMTPKDNLDSGKPCSREYPQHPIASVHAVVVRGKRILLVKRAHPPSRGYWSVPGGVVELGETIHEAAQREIREECSIEIEVNQVINVVDNIIVEGGQIRFHYVLIGLLGQYVSGELTAGSDALEARWITYDELDTLDLHPIAQRTVWEGFELASKKGVF